MDILGAILGPVVECIISPVGRELGHIFFYSKNIKEFETQLQNLKVDQERVQILVNEQKSISYAIFEQVVNWLAEVDTELRKQQTNESGSNLSCLKPRKTKKKLEHVLKLINDGKTFNKNNIGYSVPLPHTNCPTLPQDYQNLESRTLMVENIKNALADPNVSKVGVSGMGGVGKTKLLDEVKKLVLERKLFNRVIMVTIGQSKDVKQIQDEIGGMLNIKLEANSVTARSSLLQTKIIELKDNILIMLDDLWGEYDVEKDFGIPIRLASRKERCKIVMTSRFPNLLRNDFHIEKLFELNLLSEKESWKFFMEIVGDQFVEVLGIKKVAKNVVQECGGLPLALKVVAKALKGKRIQVWKDTMKKLKNHSCVGISGVEDKLYTCLKLSYDSLEDEEAKSLFVMCSVFPDDFKISMDDLQMYAMGMGMLSDINNWEDGKNRVMKLVDDLTSSYLLIDSSDKDLNGVQMHDVIRDVAKYIASKIDNRPSLTYKINEESEWIKENICGPYDAIYVRCETLRRISPIKIPPNLEFPNLRLLIISNSIYLKNIQMADTCFKEMKNLRVLDVKYMYLKISRMSSLKNLQTLSMDHCIFNDINTIGELKKLKILKIDGCDTITELPASMSQLTELMVLKVSYCRILMIHPNIISSMKKLEELSFLNSFKGWGEKVAYEGKIIENIKLSELNCLTNLSILRIEIQNMDILLNELSSERVEKLRDFKISILSEYNNVSHDPSYSARCLKLNIKSMIIVSKGGVLEKLLQRCESLHVKNDSVGFTKTIFKPNSNHVNARLKSLAIEIFEDSTDMASHHIHNNITPLFATHHEVSFSELEKLHIVRGSNVQTLWQNKWLVANAFCHLKIIEIKNCNQLRYVFPSKMMNSLTCLNTLEIEDCELLERIFEIDEGATSDNVKRSVVPLRKLTLKSLPKLKHVWNNDVGETFSNLKSLLMVVLSLKVFFQLPSSIICNNLNFYSYMEKLKYL